MPTSVLSWLDDPDPGHGIRFARADGQWDHWSYPRLAALAYGTARRLREHGVSHGDRVVIVEDSGPRFVAALFGTLLAGATATPVAPPARFGDPAGYADHLHAILTAARPHAVLAAPPANLPPLGAPRLEVPVESAGAGAPPAGPPAEYALLQFTSGTTGRVRGVRIPYPALAANVRAIQDWLAMTDDDPTASWLPVHHDMGLVGCLLAPVVTGADLWLLPPEEFVRRPLRYLECFGRHGARLTAMPGFGLAQLHRRIRPEQLDGLDFSAWRAVIVGAERLRPATLDRFLALCAPAGLRRQALLPAYGLAEATLAVTGVPLAEEWSAGEDGVVACGRALRGVTVRVVDEAGAAQPDGVTGEIVVGGESVGAGYQDGADFAGQVATGDAGYLRDGQLHVLGRYGDSLKVRGRTVFAEDLDALLGGRVTCLLGVAAGQPTAVVVAERDKSAERAEKLLRPHLDDARVVVLDVPLGTVPRTSSGKPRRRALWHSYLEGRLAPVST